MEKLSETNVAGELVNSVLIEVTSIVSPSRSSFILSSAVEDADLVALCAHIQDLQPENEDLLDRRA